MSAMATTTARSRVIHAVASTVSFLAGMAAVVLAVHIVFVVFDANPANELVKLFARMAKNIAPYFNDLFTPRNVKRAALVNYGLAAIAYLFIGHVTSNVIRRAA